MTIALQERVRQLEQQVEVLEQRLHTLTSSRKPARQKKETVTEMRSDNSRDLHNG